MVPYSSNVKEMKNQTFASTIQRLSKRKATPPKKNEKENSRFLFSSVLDSSTQYSASPLGFLMSWCKLSHLRLTPVDVMEEDEIQGEFRHSS